MKYYNDMGVDVTQNIRSIETNLSDALNSMIKLNQTNLEQKKRLETRATTIKRLRQTIKEKEEKLCQLEKKTPQTKAETPSEPTESETSPKSAKTTNSEPCEAPSTSDRPRLSQRTAPEDPK